jgi:hypothetical protein
MTMLRLRHREHARQQHKDGRGAARSEHLLGPGDQP